MKSFIPCLLALNLVIACGDDDGDTTDTTDDMRVPETDMATPTLGDVTVLLEPEDTITEGLEPGDEGESIQDGWTVTFDRYLVAIGDVDIHLSTDETVDAEAPDVFVADLTQISAAGEALWTFDGIRPGRWEVGYSTPGAGDGSMRHETVSEADYDEMVAQDWTYLIEATMTHPSGQSCPPASLANVGGATPNGNTNSRDEDCYDNATITFTWGVTAETVFGPCQIDEMFGFAVPEGGSQTVALTIHGDHIFFNGFPEGDEGGIMRLAQWIADSDLDLDGDVTREELESIAPSDLAELDERYALGAPPIELMEMWDYVIGQLKTQGHFQGEGECAFDGMAHDH
ncbi:MAG: hypothetical protein JJ863_06250 [Deltaproteobacteria bacterium]|nr:hypothetical protein [Deltaproteobacteria bacterium]